MKKTPKPKFFINRSSRILLEASIIANIAIGLLGPVYAVFVENIGGSLLDAGIAYAIFNILTGILIITLGSTKFFSKNTRPLIVIGYFLFALGNIGYIFIRTPIHLFIVQIILGLAIGILEPAWDSVYSAKLNEQQGYKRWSLWSGSTYLAVCIAAIIGGFIAFKLSFQILFIIMAIMGVISAIISVAILGKREKKRGK
jgi:MFS family permease